MNTGLIIAALILIVAAMCALSFIQGYFHHMRRTTWYIDPKKHKEGDQK